MENGKGQEGRMRKGRIRVQDNSYGNDKPLKTYENVRCNLVWFTDNMSSDQYGIPISINCKHFPLCLVTNLDYVEPKLVDKFHSILFYPTFPSHLRTKNMASLKAAISLSIKIRGKKCNNAQKSGTNYLTNVQRVVWVVGRTHK